jgi:hypothetical protein
VLAYLLWNVLFDFVVPIKRQALTICVLDDISIHPIIEVDFFIAFFKSSGDIRNRLSFGDDCS